MPSPVVTTITIDGEKFNARSASVGLTTLAGTAGKPASGGSQTNIEVVVDIQDTANMPFSTLSKLFNLAKVVTNAQIKDIRIDFWKDEGREDVVCSYSLQGWISHFRTQSGADGNHTLTLTIQPIVDKQNAFVIDISN